MCLFLSFTSFLYMGSIKYLKINGNIVFYELLSVAMALNIKVKP